MLRLRDVNGKTWDLPEAVAFVEVCDSDGKLAVLVHKLAKNQVDVYTPGDDSFDRYVATYGVKQTRVVKL